jgi:hypothetical protein
MSDLSPFPAINHMIYHRLISQKCTSNTRQIYRSERYTRIKLKKFTRNYRWTLPKFTVTYVESLCTWLFSAHSSDFFTYSFNSTMSKALYNTEEKSVVSDETRKVQKWNNYAVQKLLLKHWSRNTHINFDKGNWLDLGVMSCSPTFQTNVSKITDLTKIWIVQVHNV